MQPEPDAQNALPGRSGFLSNLVTGIRVVGSEFKWMIMGGLRAFEIRQVRRRLDREYELLGRLARPLLARRKAPPQDVDLSLKQIEFLHEEIALLEGERDKSRADFVTRRARDLGLGTPADD